MIKLLEQELLIELEQLCRYIDCCKEQRIYSEIKTIDQQCQAVINRILHFAKVSGSKSLQSQVGRLKQCYRRLLEQSIFITEVGVQRLTA